MLMVVARAKADTSPIAKSVLSYRRNTPRLGENVNHIPKQRKVEMMFGGSHEVGSGRHMRDKYI